MTTPTDGTFTTTDGCAIGYTLHAHADAGAPRVALVHSLALDRSIWNGVVAELAPRASILAYDCRGHGLSSPVDMPYTATQFADDLAQLMDHIGWPAAVVAGCSMGGCVAQAFAAKYPQRTQGACLIDTTAWYGADAPVKWRERAATAQDKGMGALIDFQLTRWFTDAWRASAANSAAIEALKTIFLANDVRCYARTCEMLGTEDLRPLLASIKAPTAVVVGAEDYATPVSMAEALHKAIAQSTLTVIANGRHITPAECPQNIARELKTLIGV
ncbi:MAG: alpha/beta hydrolase [Burkholderiales bacterium]